MQFHFVSCFWETSWFKESFIVLKCGRFITSEGPELKVEGVIFDFDTLYKAPDAEVVMKMHILRFDIHFQGIFRLLEGILVTKWLFLIFDIHDLADFVDVKFYISPIRYQNARKTLSGGWNVDVKSWISGKMRQLEEAEYS